jgi:hypothetical protein
MNGSHQLLREQSLLELKPEFPGVFFGTLFCTDCNQHGVVGFSSGKKWQTSSLEVFKSGCRLHDGYKTGSQAD